MTSREYVIQMYLAGHSVNYIVKQIYNKLNKRFFDDIKFNRFIDKNEYKNMKYCRNKVEKTLLEHISATKEMKSLL